MSSEWIEIYRSYSGEELELEVTRLKREATLYASQQDGQVGYTKALSEVRDRLHAAIRVQGERRRSSAGESGWAVPDFSGVRH